MEILLIKETKDINSSHSSNIIFNLKYKNEKHNYIMLLYGNIIKLYIEYNMILYSCKQLNLTNMIMITT